MKKMSHWFLCLVTTAVFLFFVYSGSEAVSVISEKRSPEWGQCIIIDPGHGGEDGGAISCTGFPESEYNLKIALRLNDLFHLLGYLTKMIRTEDISVYTTGETLSQKKISDLKERVRICNETKDSLLISIHQNMFSDNQYNGAQVFYAKTAGSKELAEKMQTLFISSLNPGSHRKVKKSNNIYIMEHVTCPAVLVECGFLSNPLEEAALRTEEYQKKICCVIVSSVEMFLSNT